ncbi:hypothetical protein EJ04DRAFT_598439 [Polyplosphaeria fusca]|uniref:Uncharacterized protein n=1 Tax=Polyplosphaeria fusca TaxID=682080 RepID=A0A9P4QJ32_9PLEO|nr:hypothetical protein EJ04DRAFT_598439 [Polyplosphaeria fusca]
MASVSLPSRDRDRGREGVPNEENHHDHDAVASRPRPVVDCPNPTQVRTLATPPTRYAPPPPHPRRSAPSVLSGPFAHRRTTATRYTEPHQAPSRAINAHRHAHGAQMGRAARDAIAAPRASTRTSPSGCAASATRAAHSLSHGSPDSLANRRPRYISPQHLGAATLAQAQHSTTKKCTRTGRIAYPRGFNPAQPSARSPPPPSFSQRRVPACPHDASLPLPLPHARALACHKCGNTARYSTSNGQGLHPRQQTRVGGQEPARREQAASLFPKAEVASKGAHRRRDNIDECARACGWAVGLEAHTGTRVQVLLAAFQKQNADPATPSTTSGPDCLLVHGPGRRVLGRPFDGRGGDCMRRNTRHYSHQQRIRQASPPSGPSLLLPSLLPACPACSLPCATIGSLARPARLSPAIAPSSQRHLPARHNASAPLVPPQTCFCSTLALSPQERRSTARYHPNQTAPSMACRSGPDIAIISSNQRQRQRGTTSLGHPMCRVRPTGQE